MMEFNIVVVIASVVLIIIGVPYVLSVILSPFYFKYGFGKWFYHDFLGWHAPDKTERCMYDGLSMHSHCKFCHKEIMEDSQGNWFIY